MRAARRTRRARPAGRAPRRSAGVLVLLVLEQPADQLLARIRPRLFVRRVGRPRSRGSSMRDLMCASVAAITRYSPATSRLSACIASRYSRYFSVTKLIGMSKMSSSCSRIRCSSRSSGPSKSGQRDAEGRSRCLGFESARRRMTVAGRSFQLFRNSAAAGTPGELHRSRASSIVSSATSRACALPSCDQHLDRSGCRSTSPAAVLLQRRNQLLEQPLLAVDAADAGAAAVALDLPMRSRSTAGAGSRCRTWWIPRDPGGACAPGR